MPDEGVPAERDGSRREFLSEAEDILERLSDGLRSLEGVLASGAPHLRAVDTIFREVHSLKGFAGLLGFPEIASLSHELEDLLARLRLGGALDGAVLDLLHEALDTLCESLRSLGTGGPAPSRLTTMREHLRGAAARVVQEPSPDLGGIDRPPGLLAALTEAEEHRLRDSRARGRRLALARLHADPSTLEGDLAEAARRAGELGELIATLPVGDDPGKGVALDLLVASDRTLGPGDWPHGLIRSVRELGGPVAPAPVAPADAGPSVPEPDEAAATMGLLRVPVGRLDDVLGQAGDLSIAVGALESGVRAVRERHPGDRLVRDLDPLLRAVANRLRALHRGVIDARLVSLEQVFRRIGRHVARAARIAAKEAELRTLGGQTEIDKAVMDALAPPLMHLTTNALDHGIEPPDERERTGKPRLGRLVLSAFRRGPWVVIDVSDDGRGIDLDGVRATAASCGLIRPGQVITQEEAGELIFRPGFSTARTLSEVSGRGIGLDVVRGALRRLKGTIEVRWVAGQGTTFTLTVPISLALVPALIVRSSGQRFAVPIGSIRENLRLDRSRLRTSPGGETYDHPEGTLRLVRLDRLLAVGGGERQGGPGRYAIVAGSGARRAGIVVDDFVGRQDVVVKPVGRWLRDRPGIAGATDLGDARAVLVLDPEALVARANDGYVPA